MARVFLSHASEDHRLAHEVLGWLAEAGHEVFLDQDLRAGIAVGEEWEQRLFERLRWADAVVCLSPRPMWPRRGAPRRWASPAPGAAGCCRCWRRRACAIRCCPHASTP